MVTKAITQSDLNNLEKSIRSDISREQTDLRHEDRKKISIYYFKVDDLEKSVAVNENILKNMSDNFIELKQMMKDGFYEMKEEIKGMNNKFYTREENNTIQKRLDAHDAIISRIAWGIVGGFMTILASLI